MFAAFPPVRRAVAGALTTVFMASALCTGAFASEPGPDHPAVARYPGARMRHFDYKEFEESQLVLSKPYSRSGEFLADKVLPVEGAVTYIHYDAPQSSSALQVFRNYQSSLKRSGFEELFVCERPCGDKHLGDWNKLLKARQLYLNGVQDLQYLAARRGDTYVSLAVDYSGSEPWIFLFVTEKGSLDDGRMAVTGDSTIAKALASTGKVDLYGFLFDTGKSQLKAGSDTTLGELGKVLKDNPSLSVQVVGHTDNVGKDDANQALSEARAQAVSAALTSQFGIAPDRVAALGRGASQPVAPNTAEDGRAKNRRVEIVALTPARTAGSSGGSATTSAQQGTRPWNPNTASQQPGGTGTSLPEVTNQVRTATDSVRTATDAVNAVNALRGLFGR
jgi:OOP family OmpA-OmpF porin